MIIQRNVIEIYVVESNATSSIEFNKKFCYLYVKETLFQLFAWAINPDITILMKS